MAKPLHLALGACIIQNGETMNVDATCASSNIKYPQDTELLNEARENTEAMIDVIPVMNQPV